MRNAGWAKRLVVLVVLAVLSIVPPAHSAFGASRAASGGESGAIAPTVVRSASNPSVGASTRQGESLADPHTRVNTRPNQRFDYAEYRKFVNLVLRLNDTYWSQTLPEDFGVTYTRLHGFYPYNGDDGPYCGTAKAQKGNAFYCSIDDYIAWDEQGLLIPFYRQRGDFAAAFVLAHEYGHAMQERLGVWRVFPIRVELQADCFAGSWTQYLHDNGYLEPGDLEEANATLSAIGDPAGVPWTDPDAHGTAAQRKKAFNRGLEGGALACRD